MKKIKTLGTKMPEKLSKTTGTKCPVDCYCEIQVYPFDFNGTHPSSGYSKKIKRKAFEFRMKIYLGIVVILGVIMLLIN